MTSIILVGARVTRLSGGTLLDHGSQEGRGSLGWVEVLFSSIDPTGRGSRGWMEGLFSSIDPTGWALFSITSHRKGAGH